MDALTDYKRERILRSLAIDIVRNMREVPEVLSTAGISPEEYSKLAETSFFKEMLQQAAIEWEGAENTPDRIKLKSAVLVEQALPELFGTLTDKSEALSGRVELFKTMAKLGGLGNAPVTQASEGQVFRLEINFSDKKQNIIIENQPIEIPSKVTDEQFGDVTTEKDEL